MEPQPRSPSEYSVKCAADEKDKSKVNVEVNSTDNKRPLVDKGLTSAIVDAVVFWADGETIASYTLVNKKSK
jgi:hypothetical protein